MGKKYQQSIWTELSTISFEEKYQQLFKQNNQQSIWIKVSTIKFELKNEQSIWTNYQQSIWTELKISTEISTINLNKLNNN